MSQHTAYTFYVYINPFDGMGEDQLLGNKLNIVNLCTLNIQQTLINVTKLSRSPFPRPDSLIYRSTIAQNSESHSLSHTIIICTPHLFNLGKKSRHKVDIFLFWTKNQETGTTILYLKKQLIKID